MNKIYKLVWSKTKNMYVAVAEYAKLQTKKAKSGVIRRAVIAGVLVTVLSFGTGMSAEAAQDGISWGTFKNTHTDILRINHSEWNSDNYGYADIYIGANKTTGVLEVFDVGSADEGYTTIHDSHTGTVYTYGGGSYTASNGISLSGTTFSAIAGTNVTVNSNGISVTGNGSVASGDTGLIDGGELYAEVRPSDNGNYEEYFSTLL